MPYDLRDFVNWIVSDFEASVRVGEQAGAYTRSTDEHAVHLYGTADMACVLYTLGRLPTDAVAREQWVATLRSLQDPATGYLLAQPADHSPLHNTAFALGALEFFDAQPLHPLRFASLVNTREKLAAFLGTLDWRTGVYRGSHDGAGIGSAMALVPGAVPPEWFDWYFDWLDARFDPANGMLGVDKPASGDFDQIGGTFHYVFLYEHFDRPLRHAEARTDAILGLQLPSGNWHDGNVWWLTLDALYMLARDQRRVEHRRDDVREAFRRAVDAAYDRIGSDAVRRTMKPHPLTAVVSLFTVAQQFLGDDEVRTDGPLELVLDRRPFI